MKTLNKSNIWDLQENDIFRLWEAAEKDADIKDNARHYIDIIKSAFDLEELKVDKPEIIKKYEERGFKVGQLRMDDSTKEKWAVKKRPILRVTDLTYENIHHISRKLADGYEVLEISKGLWVEAIFAKDKPEVERPRMKFDEDLDKDEEEISDDEDLPEVDDRYDTDDDDDDAFDEDKLTEESYRTTFDTDPEDLGLEAEEISDDYED